MIKIYTKIEHLKINWNNTFDFLKVNFLKPFYINHPKINHLFIVGDSYQLYAHIFKLKFKKTSNYLNNSFLLNILFRGLNLNVLYLTNSFITNIPSFINKDKIPLNDLLSTIKHKYLLIVIPDFFYKELKIEKNNFTKVEVEEEMMLHINNHWNCLEDYLKNLKTKYRKKIKLVLKKSNHIQIKCLSSEDVDDYEKEMQILFDQIITESSFNGPRFNIKTLGDLLEKDIITLYGYFKNEKIVGFASEIHQQKTLYSYYVGFDKSSNKSLAIYGRILVETIKNAITSKKEKIVFGRTANEYKSNFGAVPMKSFIFLKTNNVYTNKIFKILFTRLKIQPWIQRSPFKQKN